jgi:hypothetical protein
MSSTGRPASNTIPEASAHDAAAGKAAQNPGKKSARMTVNGQARTTGEKLL